jgi:hypothetical protein
MMAFTDEQLSQIKAAAQPIPSEMFAARSCQTRCHIRFSRSFVDAAMASCDQLERRRGQRSLREAPSKDAHIISTDFGSTVSVNPCRENWLMYCAPYFDIATAGIWHLLFTTDAR